MMRRPPWRSIVVGSGMTLLAYLLFLVVLAPATLLDSGLQHATAGTLRLAQAHGTLWSGHGRLELRDNNGQGVGKDLTWTLQSRALWRGRFDYEITLDHAAAPFPVRISPRKIEASHVDFSLPASALGLAVPRLAPLRARGELVFHIASFSGSADHVAADAAVTWKDASSALASVAPLGTYELRLHDVAGSLKATLRTLDGPLQLVGDGLLRGDGQATFSTTARVDASHRAQLAPLLRLIAVEQANGDFVLQFTPPLGAAPRVDRP